MIRLAIVTLSDSRSKGKLLDESGDAIAQYAPRLGAEVVLREILPDDYDALVERLRALSTEVDLVLTTGGTGVGPRDVTPDATLAVIEKELPGFGEIMRVRTFERTPRSVLSRATAGVAGRCLIVNLPGSPRGVREGLELLCEAIRHGVEVARGEARECAPKEEPHG
ncbi:MAG: MogA/MoaB family molybdenum cofactor biosynthesis protein [Planctomycetota bacterium]